MSIQLLQWSDVHLVAGGGDVNLTLVGNADTNLRARCWWFQHDDANAVRIGDVGSGEAFTVGEDEVRSGARRRLGFFFAAAPAVSSNPHLRVQLEVAQAGRGAALHVYELDLPAGHNVWRLADGITLQV